MKDDCLINNQMEYFRKIIKLSNYNLSEKQIDQFKNYLIKLLQWNKRTNLISKRDEKNVVLRHFLESIAILDIIEFPINSCLIDVGTGAGFPGLPLKIVRPDLNLTLLDSKRLKILFLSDILKALNLSNVDIVQDRAEIACIKPAFNRKFDFVIVRAVARLLKIYKWTNQFLKFGATILALKGGDIEEEINALQKNYERVNLKLLPLKSPLLKENRGIVIVKIN